MPSLLDEPKDMLDKIILSSAYFPPINYMALLAGSEHVIIDPNEHFIKQTYRNRCHILGVNGVQHLSVPVNRKNHLPLKDIKISYAEDWQKVHWGTIVSAYGKSAFFEFYRDELEPIFSTKHEFLLDLNMEVLESANSMIGITLSIEVAENFIERETEPYDFRELISPKKEFSHPELSIDLPSYFQVFSDRHAFTPNLSVLDLLFNMGPESEGYLESVVV